MKILVLGGAGYIGSHTVYELIDTGHEVVVIDNLLTGFREAVHPEAKFYEGDIRDKKFLDEVFDKEKIDGVIHFAASSQVGESMTNPLKYYNNNLCGTEVLLESMVEHGIDKIVFSSTAATYGEPESIPILETDRTLPTNCYGETKLSMEKMFKWTSKAHDLRYVSLRYFNACGAHPNGKGGESSIFNLGNGVGFTVKEVIDVAREVTKHPIPAKEEPRRAGDPSTLIASSEKAKDILGWNPKYADLHTIIETAWKWHENHPNGY